ncbi:DNA-binding transcriptional MerR regulator [Nocardia alba]|uniref:DNA-binding transcriptional MerR regulator n=2 Tax=Nocardia alba TaxID=225051 RepID=A0A4R1FB01_9NOCA|nr:MerR family transcriptional regulator [Nocardia alba]TCJ89974.1 DNA-binding transcriptional MerR regulator [Nocardia alba]
MGETGIEQMWKVGELAAEAGLTVRTLHHYDRIGLVCPAERTNAGHRLYTEADVERLYQVLALRQLGLGLDQIANVLAGTMPMARVLGVHRDRLAAQVVAMQDLHALVTTLATTAESQPEISADHFLDLIRRTVMVDDTIGKYFTQEVAESFTALYFAQLTARQSALELWYAEDARLTVGETPFVGTTVIFEQLSRFPQGGYSVSAVDVEPGADASAVLRVAGNLMLDATSEARPFETSFTLNSFSMIAGQTFQGI